MVFDVDGHLGAIERSIRAEHHVLGLSWYGGRLLKLDSRF